MIDYRVYIVTDRQIAQGRPLENVVAQAIAGGATIVQLREKNASTRDMIIIGNKLHEITKKADIPLIVNDRIDVALAINAEGVHVGKDDMPANIARKLIGKNKILGISAKTVEQAVLAQKDSADYIGVGDIFGTASKLDAGKPIGLDTVKEISQHISIPFVGIGAISINNVAEVIQAGASGVAVISAVIGAENPQKAAHALRTIVDKELKRNPPSHKVTADEGGKN